MVDKLAGTGTEYPRNLKNYYIGVRSQCLESQLFFSLSNRCAQNLVLLLCSLYTYVATLI